MGIFLQVIEDIELAIMESYDVGVNIYGVAMNGDKDTADAGEAHER